LALFAPPYRDTASMADLTTSMADLTTSIADDTVAVYRNTLTQDSETADAGWEQVCGVFILGQR